MAFQKLLKLTAECRVDKRLASRVSDEGRCNVGIERRRSFNGVDTNDSRTPPARRLDPKEAGRMREDRTRRHVHLSDAFVFPSLDKPVIGSAEVGELPLGSSRVNRKPAGEFLREPGGKKLVFLGSESSGSLRGSFSHIQPSPIIAARRRPELKDAISHFPQSFIVFGVSVPFSASVLSPVHRRPFVSVPLRPSRSTARKKVVNNVHLTAIQIAEKTGYSPKTIRTAFSAGAIPSFVKPGAGKSKMPCRVAKWADVESWCRKRGIEL